MSAETIIQQIKKDSQSEIKKIQKEIEKQTKDIINQAKNEAEEEATKILERGKQQSENRKKIMISKAYQDSKIETMNAQEKIIEECFVKAHHKLSTLDENTYRKIVTRLIIDGKEKLGGQCTIVPCRNIDREIAKEQGIPVDGSVETCGGILLRSKDGRVILDHTFDGILRREKDKIRNIVGKLLFSEKKM